MNTHERSLAEPVENVTYSVTSRYWSGAAAVQTFTSRELISTKIRALYQRKSRVRTCPRRLEQVPGVVDHSADLGQRRGQHVTLLRAHADVGAVSDLAQPGDDIPLVRLRGRTCGGG